VAEFTIEFLKKVAKYCMIVNPQYLFYEHTTLSADVDLGIAVSCSVFFKPPTIDSC
jgi:hypothetical protein